MGHSSSSTNYHLTEVHNKDITQRNNNVENENNHYKETNKIHNNLYGDKAYGGAVASNGDSNYGTATYKLVNLDDASLDLQNLGLFGSLTSAISEGSKLGGEIWKAADKKSYDQMGGKIMGGVGAGADAFGDMDKKHHLGKKMFGKKDDDWDFINLNQQPTTAIVASPEQAMELLNLNSQLDQPYEIKGAYLI